MMANIICCCNKMIDAETCRTQCPKGKALQPESFGYVAEWEQEDRDKWKELTDEGVDCTRR